MEQRWLDLIFENRSSVFPSNPKDDQFHMDDNGNIFIYLDKRWQEVDDIRLEY
jgi:hypothetical protein